MVSRCPRLRKIFGVESGCAQLLARSERLPSSALPTVGLLMHVIAWRCLGAPRRIGTEPKCFCFNGIRDAVEVGVLIRRRVVYAP